VLKAKNSVEDGKSQTNFSVLEDWKEKEGEKNIESFDRAQEKYRTRNDELDEKRASRGHFVGCWKS